RDIDRQASERLRYADGLQQQIGDLRTQLGRYSEALEADLHAGRDRIEKRVQEALGYEREFQDSAKQLVDHLRGRPECREVLEGLDMDERSDRPVSSTL